MKQTNKTENPSETIEALTQQHNDRIREGALREAIARITQERGELLVELEQTTALARSLVKRAARIDAKLLATMGETVEYEIGEITRMRQQLLRNEALITEIEGKALKAVIQQIME